MWGSNMSKLYIDGSSPKRCLSARQTRTLVRKLVAGFNAHGLQKGDCVCVVSFNDVSFPSSYAYLAVLKVWMLG